MRLVKIGMENSALFLPVMKNAELILAVSIYAHLKKLTHFSDSIVITKKKSRLFFGLMWWINLEKVSLVSNFSMLKIKNGVKLTLGVPMFSHNIFISIKKEAQQKENLFNLK